MPVFVVGLNHRSAPLPLLERLAIDPERRPKALALLLEREHVKEGVILSTCNRVEIYTAIDRFHDGGDAVRRFVTELHGIGADELADYLYAYYEDRAASRPCSTRPSGSAAGRAARPPSAGGSPPRCRSASRWPSGSSARSPAATPWSWAPARWPSWPAAPFATRARRGS
jgi:hypothetical protein